MSVEKGRRLKGDISVRIVGVSLLCIDRLDILGLLVSLGWVVELCRVKCV